MPTCCWLWVPWPAGLLIGAGIGTLSGLTGTGGAIFLTPIPLCAHWMPTRMASGTSVAFVWINSLTALLGLGVAGATLPVALPLWLGVVVVSALIGTQLGLQWLPVQALRHALGIVLLVAAGKRLLTSCGPLVGQRRSQPPLAGAPMMTLESAAVHCLAGILTTCGPHHATLKD